LSGAPGAFDEGESDATADGFALAGIVLVLGKSPDLDQGACRGARRRRRDQGSLCGSRLGQERDLSEGFPLVKHAVPVEPRNQFVGCDDLPEKPVALRSGLAQNPSDQSAFYAAAFWIAFALLALIVVGVHWARGDEAPAAIVPDPTLTPGAVRTTDAEEICASGTQAQRHWSRERDDRIMVEYGLPLGPHPNYEVDHLIPLGIGGADDDKNL
jgi:hypothetical protein